MTVIVCFYRTRGEAEMGILGEKRLLKIGWTGRINLAFVGGIHSPDVVLRIFFFGGVGGRKNVKFTFFFFFPKTKFPQYYSRGESYPLTSFYLEEL